MKYAIILITVLTILLVACTAPVEKTVDQTLPTKEVVPEKKSPVAKEIIPPPAKEVVPEKETTTEEVEVVKTSSEDPFIEKLVDIGKSKDNYQYHLQSRKKDQYGNFDNVFYEVYKRGTKAKKVYGELRKIRIGDYYDQVYFDFDEQEALGICTERGLICDPIINNSYRLDFDSQNFRITPQEVLANIDSSAEIVETALVNKRKATIIEYMEGDNKVSVTLDNYYGLPLEHQIFIIDDDEKELIEENRFTIIFVNGVKKADVNLDDFYEVTE